MKSQQHDVSAAGSGGAVAGSAALPPHARTTITANAPRILIGGYLAPIGERADLLPLGMKKLAVEIWSDLACPWCYVGKRRLEAALAQFPHAAEVEITWRAFELDP